MRAFIMGGLAFALCAVACPAGAQTVYSGSGATTTTAVTDFRTALGSLNPNVAGSFGTGRREINWDGVPSALADPNSLPGNFFNVNSPRGVVLATPGTGLLVSANAVDSLSVEFGSIDPNYPGLFATFSAQRLFTAVGSNIVDVTFFLPGSTTAAFTNGFGSVFTDVDLANSTTLSFFGVGNAFLGTFSVPNITGNETLSFLGILFSDPVISRVRITSGNAVLAPNQLESGATDLVVMDDFIYGEPTTNAVPEPATWALLLLGFASIGVQLRRRRHVDRRHSATA